MIKTTSIIAVGLLTATTAFAAPQVMNDEQLDSVVAGALGGWLTGTLTLPNNTVKGDVLTVADGLEAWGSVDTTIVDPSTGTGATVDGGIISTPPAP